MAKRVLVVDDAIFMRNMIKDIFSGGGFDVVGEASNGLEAIERFRELKPDLVTMDIVMPFKSGIDATKEIIKIDSKALIVMCSALGQESLVMEAIEAGASDFVVKPFKSEEVLVVVKKVLGKRLIGAAAQPDIRMDMSKYLGLFVTEATEHLEKLGADLLRLEKERSPELVDSIFRHAHSVKGMAASMGFEPITQLAHQAEDMIGLVRDHPAVLDGTGVDLLLRTTDVLTTMVRLATDGLPLKPDSGLAAALTRHLARLQGHEPNQAAPAEAPPPREPAAALATIPPQVLTAAPLEAKASPGERWSRFRVTIRVAKTCVTPGVRAFLVHKKLSLIGQIFETRPLMEDVRAGRLPQGEMSLVLETRTGEAGIHKILSQVADLESAVVGFADEPVPAESEGAARVIGAEPPRTIRIQTETLDHFLDSAGELLLATANLREIAKDIPDRYRTNLDEGIDRLHGIIKDLHDRVVRARMTPLALITDRLPRAVRDICRRTGREADLVITGAEIELDRAILDELADPVLHLLRNCLDHGLEAPAVRAAAGKPERGRVRVAARRDRDGVVLEIDDDGQGMDTDRLQAAAIERGLITVEQAQKLGHREALMLACLPGVSTASNISDLSGRGVGMDAVKRAVEGVGGTLEIESDLGQGTRFRLRLPLTVAVINVLLVGVGEEIFGLPLTKVVSALELTSDDLFTSQGAEMLSYGGQLVPIHGLSPVLGIPERAPTQLKPYLVVDGEGSRLAIRVDRLMGQEEVVLKPLTRPLDMVPGLSGVTILGSGRPIFILDVPRLI